MLKMIQKRLPIELSDEDAAYIQQNLQTRFNSLFYRVRMEYLNRLGLDASAYKLTTSANGDLVVGELFMPEPGLICYLKSMRNSGILEAGVITNETQCDLDSFFAEVRDVLSEIRSDLPAWQIPAEYAPLAIEGAEQGDAVLNPQEMAAARALMDGTSRELLAKIKEAGSIFLNKLFTEDRQDTEARIRHFEELSLINKEYAVLCRRTGQQILRVSDRSTLDESSQKAFKCFICGSPISEEVIEEIVTSNELCTTMFTDDRWLFVLVQGLLNELGVESKDVRVYRAPNLPTRVFLSLNGQRLLLVLCTAPLDLDQANLIGAHLAAYGLRETVIISTDNVSTLMRHHLAKLNDNTRFHFICDMQNLERDLKGIILEQQREFVASQLNDISKATPVCIPTLVLSRMLPQEDVPAEAEVCPEVACDVPVADAEIFVAEGGKVAVESEVGTECGEIAAEAEANAVVAESGTADVAVEPVVAPVVEEKPSGKRGKKGKR